MDNLKNILFALGCFLIILGIIYFAGYRNGYVEGSGTVTSDTLFTTPDTVWQVDTLWFKTEVGEAEVIVVESNETENADSLHQITFTVPQGTAYIEYNVERRHADYVFEPSEQIIKTRTIKNELLINSVQYVEQPIDNSISRRDVGMGCVIGAVIAYGSVWLAGNIL